MSINPNEYMKQCLRTDFPNGDYTPVTERLAADPTLMRKLHAAVGMSGECGEILDLLKKSVIYGKELDEAKLKEELGDALWYFGIMLVALGSSFEEVMAMNAEKLQKRYPNGYTNEAAILREDVKI
jgi:NTP pyrophosphatase (non-canonical NTP hydrolase)